jgi:hypothetical protein
MLSYEATVLALLLAAMGSAASVQVRGSGQPPQLAFACELSVEPLRSLFSDPAVVADLQSLKAGVSLALVDLSPQRAEVVRRLNAAGIPVTAWLALPADQGYYFNAGNAPQAAARFAKFEKWTAAFGLRWAAVGLDIEPGVQEFAALQQGHRWKFAATLVRRYFDTGSVTRARQAYAELIRQIQARGYPVQTYQLLFMADERRVHTTLLERLFGLVDVRSDDEVLMLYSSFKHESGGALIWKYGPDAQTIVVGVTAGDPQPDPKFRPLNWEELSRDLVIASHFTREVGVYSLEGCVRQGFLGRLVKFDWSQTVSISADSMARVARFRLIVQAVLWTVSRLPYLIAALVAVIWFLWRRRRRRAAMPAGA